MSQTISANSIYTQFTAGEPLNRITDSITTRLKRFSLPMRRIKYMNYQIEYQFQDEINGSWRRFGGRVIVRDTSLNNAKKQVMLRALDKSLQHFSISSAELLI
ncbi:hypothetical protein G3R49_09305 [Shewanella sp. WXL01]|uniref:Uncharacterized protein n=1 Tax=Shewanella maritima TaxID=2520507 RepID=A0A411PJN3_9GAMM|nr:MULTISPECIES: hypothetical protein [Shewanella]NKF50766.1 hypothetical protein [Shewanella sp. WXL01]QBF83753.1 hypothetical protein EXU30_14415 [Shewanella maritima]